MSVPLIPTASGPNVGLTLHLTPLPPSAAEATPCVPDIVGLFWFSDESGAFDAVSEAAYTLAGSPAGPTLAVAKLGGEICALPVTWNPVWVPTSEASPGGPVSVSDGAYLVFYADSNTAPGVLTLSATCNGLAFGPITMEILDYLPPRTV